tara:strand:+ start:141 stop:1421 length:1281 start_codon:yes stop_codon:yes gene_type:complete
MGVMSYKKWFQLNEKMGVPVGIEDAAQKIYNSTISTLSDSGVQEYLNKYIEDNERPTFDIPIPSVSYGDETITIVKHTIEFHNHVDIDPIVSSLSVSFGGDPIKGSFTKMKNKKDVVLEIFTHIAFDFKKYSTRDAVDYFKGKDKTEYISSISHELMHEYDNRKRKTTSFKDRAKYNTESNFRSGVKQIDDFLHKMYYMNGIESVVRPSQVFTKLKKDGVTKSGFLKAIRNDNTWKSLEDAREFSVDGMIDDIANDDISMKSIREILDSINAWYLVKGNKDDDRAIVDAMLNLVFINISNMNREHLDQCIDRVISHDPFIMLFKETEEQAQSAYRNMMKDLDKYKEDHIGYYKSIERYFKTESNKVMRKISKLYDMMPDDTSLNNKSIINRELHQKISNKKSDIVDTKIRESFTFDDFINRNKSKG